MTDEFISGNIIATELLSSYHSEDCLSCQASNRDFADSITTAPPEVRPAASTCPVLATLHKLLPPETKSNAFLYPSPKYFVCLKPSIERPPVLQPIQTYCSEPLKSSAGKSSQKCVYEWTYYCS